MSAEFIASPLPTGPEFADAKQKTRGQIPKTRDAAGREFHSPRLNRDSFVTIKNVDRAGFAIPAVRFTNLWIGQGQTPPVKITSVSARSADEEMAYAVSNV